MPVITSPPSELDENPNKFTNFLLKIAGNHIDDADIIIKDHCYARPWNWKPESVYVKPVKKLFFPKSLISSKSKDSLNKEELIDVDGDNNDTFPYDLSKIRQAMDEFQRVANFIRTEDNDDWEEKIDKILWSKEQRKIFFKVVSILNSEKTARLARINSMHEPILRRTCLDSTAKRFRETLASTNWDWRITQWLHALLFDNLPQEYLAIYLDILQTMRQKIPQLIDKMITVPPNSNSKGTSVTWETLGPLLKKTWDPVGQILFSNKPKKLPGNPILIVVPSGVTNVLSSRQQKWVNQLGMLGMTIVVNSHLGVNSNRMTMVAALEQLVQASRAKIQDIRMDYAGRPIILIGFNSGAALACQLGQMEHVTGIVCLGFPYNTVDGRRGSPNDILLDVRCPVMFVIGEKAVLSHVDDIEDLRERMLVCTSLVVVGSADDQLRIPSFKKVSEKITQNMVDRCVLDEIGDFVSGILLQPELPMRSMHTIHNHDNRAGRRVEISRKRKVSTSSSVDSEPQSPLMKKHSVVNNNIQGIHTNVIPKGALVALTGTASTQTPKRKNARSYGNRTYPDHITATRINKPQKDSSGGITLNIGSLASLAPVGPIRFDPSSISLQSPGIQKATGNTLKSTSSFIKVAKNNSVNIGGPQNVAKIKMILPTKKIPQQRGPNTYKNMNINNMSDSSIVNVMNPSNTLTRTPSNVPSATVTSGISGTMSTLPSIHAQKNQASNSGSMAAKSMSSSSILFTPKNSTTPTSTITSTSSSAAKVSDIQTPTNKVGFRGFQQHEQKSPVAIDRSSTIKTRSPRPKALAAQNVPKQTPKLQDPKNLQIMAPSAITSSSTTYSSANTGIINQGLENILDIPIIIADDGENLNTFEAIPSPALGSAGNKMVLINKATEQEHIAPVLSHKPNKIEQKSVVLNRGTTMKPTVKYTRIILTKKNETEEKSNPVILTKTRKSNKQVAHITDVGQSTVSKAPGREN